MVSRPALLAFLLRVRRRTEPVGDATAPAPLVSGSRQREYREDSLLYRDVWFGVRSFVGQETVYDGDTPVWAMGYAGGVLAAAEARDDVLAIYAVLRAALARPAEDAPYRGPKRFAEGDYIYVNQLEKEAEAFSGVETITRRAAPVYRLRYAGRPIA
ncbi:MAG TPA: DUF5680 domain-containing protein [Candidatus Limnocylindria bacterium]|nr:DUF5680 domain-containing protein [Candidatus Limnocylindria bacterium]